MLFALLFDGQDQLIAATHAANWQAEGDSYWSEIYASPLAIDEHCQTACIEIDQPELGDRLNSLELDDDHLSACRDAIDELLAATSSGESPMKRAA